MAMTAKADDQTTAAQAEAPEKDSPLLDLSDAAVKKFIKTAKARGFVTLDALNAVLPSEEVSPDQIEDTMSMLSDMGITVVESEDPEEAPAQDAEDAEEEEPTTAARSRPRRASRPSRRPAPSPPSAPTIPCACTCATWARWSCSRARARSPSPSASRPAARP